MKLTIGNNNFTDIGTAVFYTQSDLDNRTYSKVQHKSNSSLLYERDFSEYNFSYEVEKDKFNDEFLVDYLGNKTLSLFEPTSNSLEKLESIIFPTLGEEDWNGPEDKYFGTTIINNQIFALLHADIGIKRIELYNGMIYSNNDLLGESVFIDVDSLNSLGKNPISEPYFIITLGEPGEGEVVESTDLVRQKELSDEVEYEKMVWLLITSNNRISGVNLSYKSWTDSINPNRNMNQYILRNDEFWSTKDYVKINEILPDTDNNVVIDANSGTLLSTEKIDISRLLAYNKIKGKVEECKYSKEHPDIPNYFPYTTYKMGDRVYYGGTIWESVADNNFNSNPALSTKWIKSEIIENNRSTLVTVKVIPEGMGYCKPMGVISIPSLDHRMTFKIYPSAGFELNEYQPCLLDDDSINVLTDDDYDYSVPEDVVAIINWRNIIATGELVFNLEDVGCKINFTAEYNGEFVPYTSWTSTFNETSFFPYLLIEGADTNDPLVIEDPYTNSNGEMSLTVGKSADIIFKELSNYSISSVEVFTRKSVNSDPVTTTITPTINENGDTVIRIENVDFTEAELKLILTQKQITARIIEHTGFDISNTSIRTISGNPVTFKFIDSEYIISSDGSQVLADNLDRVILTDSKGNELVIGRLTSFNAPLTFGFSTVYFSRINSPIGSINYGEYTLRINNLYFDTNIQILKR